MTEPAVQHGSETGRTASVGILTYQRPESLERCLERVQKALERPLPVPWRIVDLIVIDNDPAGSAARVAAHRPTDGVPVRYVLESTPGIAAARNRALDETTADVLVFIDDDEVPGEGWPNGLLTVMADTGAAMVGGPVHSEFLSSPPSWIAEGRFFERDDPIHGSVQPWLRSGNLVIDLDQVRAADLRFDQRFGQGEDTAFTRRAWAAGLELRWSSLGAVTEYVGDDRLSVQWRLRREYVSHRTWTRSTLDLAAGRRDRVVARLQTLAVAGGRLVDGAATLVAGAITARKATTVRGAVKLAGVAGKLTEVVRYRPPTPSPDEPGHLPDPGTK